MLVGITHLLSAVCTHHKTVMLSSERLRRLHLRNDCEGWLQIREAAAL
jgi:hypothetical protein